MNNNLTSAEQHSLGIASAMLHNNTVSKTYLSSNHIKHGNFTVILENQWVLKFYSLTFPHFEKMIERVGFLLPKLSSQKYSFPRLHQTIETPFHKVVVWNYLPGASPFQFSWNNNRGHLLSVLDSLVEVTLEIRNAGTSGVPDSWTKGYELSEIYEAAFETNNSPRWLTHGDLNLGNICIGSEKLGVFDFDNISFQKRDHIMAQLTLFFLMAPGFEKYSNFQEGLNEVWLRVCSVMDNIEKIQFVKNLKNLLDCKVLSSVDPKRMKYWTSISNHTNRMVHSI